MIRAAVHDYFHYWFSLITSLLCKISRKKSHFHLKFVFVSNTTYLRSSNHTMFCVINKFEWLTDYQNADLFSVCWQMRTDRVGSNYYTVQTCIHALCYAHASWIILSRVFVCRFRTMSSQVRQNFHQDCEAAINRQINLELYASYVYLSMVRVQ